MKLIGVGRVGKDVELRYTTGGEAVANISLAWNYGLKEVDGKKPTQWLDAALFGKRAETLAPYLKKGTSLFVDMRDVHIREFQMKDGKQAYKLTGIVDSIEFAGDRVKEKEPIREQESSKEQDDIPF